MNGLGTDTLPGGTPISEDETIGHPAGMATDNIGSQLFNDYIKMFLQGHKGIEDEGLLSKAIGSVGSFSQDPESMTRVYGAKGVNPLTGVIPFLNVVGKFSEGWKGAVDKGQQKAAGAMTPANLKDLSTTWKNIQPATVKPATGDVTKKQLLGQAYQMAAKKLYGYTWGELQEMAKTNPAAYGEILTKINRIPRETFLKEWRLSYEGAVKTFMTDELTTYQQKAMQGTLTREDIDYLLKKGYTAEQLQQRGIDIK